MTNRLFKEESQSSNIPKLIIKTILILFLIYGAAYALGAFVAHYENVQDEKKEKVK